MYFLALTWTLLMIILIFYLLRFDGLDIFKLPIGLLHPVLIETEKLFCSISRPMKITYQSWMLEIYCSRNCVVNFVPRYTLIKFNLVFGSPVNNIQHFSQLKCRNLNTVVTSCRYYFKNITVFLIRT